MIEVKKTTTGGSAAGEVTSTYTGSGINMRIFSGLLSIEWRYTSGFVMNIYWDVIAGDGYTDIN